MEKAKHRTFRPWPENQERLEFAEKLDINVSDVINEALAESAKKVIERRVQLIRKVLSVPVP